MKDTLLTILGFAMLISIVAVPMYFAYLYTKDDEAKIYRICEAGFRGSCMYVDSYYIEDAPGWEGCIFNGDDGKREIEFICGEYSVRKQNAKN